MGEILLEAELAFQRYKAEKGTGTLIAWFRAEVKLLPAGESKERQSAYHNDFLTTHQEQVEQFATAYRDARLVNIKSQAA